MPQRACIALLLLLSACATTDSSLGEGEAPSPRIANLQRAAQYPWTDDGRCVVREASNKWPVLAERCFHALDHDRVKLRDVTGRCAVASAGAVAVGVGLCLFAAPEIIVGAVIVVGVVVVAAAIQEEWEAYERSASRESRGPKAPTRPSFEKEPMANREPTPGGLGRDYLPPVPTDLEPRGRRPECTPKRVPPKGGNPFHNKCADNVPFNAFRGANALVNGKAFDAFQPATRMLWEVKTTAIETYNPFVQRMEIAEQVKEGLRERDLAAACGYDFVIGVLTEAHRQMLKQEAPDLKVELMEWCK